VSARQEASAGRNTGRVAMTQAESPDEKTTVDLGDDLLEKTAVVQADPRTIEASAENARILLNEGFPDEAKKILRQLLLKNRNDVQSQKLLEEIHNSELKQLFVSSESNTRKSFTQGGGRFAFDESILNVDSDQILRALDEEFDLDFGDRNPEIFTKLDLELAGSSPRDQLDLAISFLEMELYTHANQLLRALIKQGNHSEVSAGVAVSLLAQGYLMNHQPYEAISVLQPFINDADTSIEDKVDFLYLMARSNEALDKKSEALGWYLHVEESRPGYRDTPERIRQLKPVRKK
jgi:tetratricopeptide (TPR) repeat protein